MYIEKRADGGYVDERVGTFIDTKRAVLKEMSKDLSENLTKFSPDII